MSVDFVAKAWQGIGGAPALSQIATQYLLKQLEELRDNRAMQPVYIQWNATAMPGAALNASELHDGWFIIDDLLPDYANYVVTGLVHCRMTVTSVAPAPPRRVAMAYTGGALPSNYSGTPLNLVALPVGSTALEASFTRQGAEGLIPSILSPAASPEPFVPPSISSGNLWKGGVHVYDTINTAAFAVPAGASIQTLFRSIGNDATGTLNAWTTDAGSPSIASNLVTMPLSGGIHGGHVDWGDCTATARFRWNTSSQPTVNVHANSGSYNGTASYIRGCVDGSALRIDKSIAGAFTNNLANTAAALTNNTFYWMQVSMAGQVCTVKLFADSAGAMGAQIGSTITATITDPVLQTGQIGLGEAAGVAGCAFGGAFANVCQVTGPLPKAGVYGGWVGLVSSGEPAFCWSKIAPYAGTYSLSIYNAHSSATGYLDSGGGALPTGVTTILAAAAKGTGSPAAFYISDGGSAFKINPPIDGTWHVGSETLNSAFSNLVLYVAGQGTYYFDNITIYQGTTPIFGDGFEPDRNAMWVEVFATDHDFVGDCVLTNGLQLLLLQAASSTSAISWTTAYLWNTALAVANYQPYATIYAHDNTGTTINLRSYSMIRIGPEECALALNLATQTSGQVFTYTLRLQRGRYEVRLDEKPLSAAMGGLDAIILSLPAIVKIAYNSTKVADQALSETAPAFATDYGYGAGFINSATYPFIAGFLYQNEPGTYQPGFLGSPSGYLLTGDSISIPANATRVYGFFAIPFGVSGSYSTANLQAEGELGSFMTGWSAISTSNESGTGAGRCLSGTASGNANTFGTAFIPAPGSYACWFRVKVTSAAGSASEMTLGLWDNDSSAYVISTTYKANQSGTSYAWIYVGSTPVTPTAGHNMRFRAVTAATLGTDWFIDEAALVPLKLTVDNRGPQDLWQQFMSKLSTRMVRN